jgi:hypothetical protein
VSSDAEILAERYGRKPKRASRAQRNALIAAMGILLVAFFVWAWSVALESSNRAEVEVASFVIEDAQHATVEVKPIHLPAKATTCAIQVQNEKFAIVGFRELTFNPGDLAVRTLNVNTTELGVSASIWRCW